MRPFDSAPLLAKICISPLGALFFYSLLFGLTTSTAVAQTRLNSSQVIPLQGAVQGAFASTKLRDLNSAVDHGNGTTNAINAAISDCGVAISCSIIIPPSYGTSEKIPGYQLNYATPGPASTIPGNLMLFDQRFGEARLADNYQGFPAGLLNPISGWLYNYYSKAAQSANLSGLYLRQWSLDGGNNQQASALGYADKTEWATLILNSISHTPGQHVSVVLATQSTSLGNSTPINNQITCFGGYNAQADLGCHALDNTVIQGNVEYGGTLTGSPTAAASSVSISPNQGQYTQGAGRFLVKTNAGTISAGSISQLNKNTGSTSIVGTGTSWPVSSAIAQLGTNVSQPGSATVTPSNFTTGAMSAIQTSSLICVADQESFEMIRPTSVTATSFTANFAKIHPGNAVIAAGGLCGYLLDLTADEVTNSTYPTKSQTIIGTLHFAWPIIGSSSASAASFWVAGDGGYQSMVSRWNATSSNGYVLYPFAEVTSVQQSGTLSDTLALGPNNVSWSSGDSVAEFLYPAAHVLMGNSVIESYYPNITPTNGFWLKYNSPLQGTDSMLSLSNNAPTTFYSSHGGVLPSPMGVRLGGRTNQSVTADLPGDKATIGIGCSSPCTATNTLMAAANAAYYDFLWYDAGNKRFVISTNVNSSHYYFAGNQFLSPFPNVSLANDSNSRGYIAAQQIRSNVAANSDTSGELVLSNASSFTRALQGSYSSHPECLARPQFDPGSTNRSWVTYSGSSFTVNFAAPVTGTVSYSCLARN